MKSYYKAALMVLLSTNCAFAMDSQLDGFEGTKSRTILGIKQEPKKIDFSEICDLKQLPMIKNLSTIENKERSNLLGDVGKKAAEKALDMLGLSHIKSEIKPGKSGANGKVFFTDDFVIKFSNGKTFEHRALNDISYMLKKDPARGLNVCLPKQEHIFSLTLDNQETFFNVHLLEKIKPVSNMVTIVENIFNGLDQDKNLKIIQSFGSQLAEFQRGINQQGKTLAHGDLNCENILLTDCKEPSKSSFILIDNAGLRYVEDPKDEFLIVDPVLFTDRVANHGCSLVENMKLTESSFKEKMSLILSSFYNGFVSQHSSEGLSNIKNLFQQKKSFDLTKQYEANWYTKGKGHALKSYDKNKKVLFNLRGELEDIQLSAFNTACQKQNRSIETPQIDNLGSSKLVSNPLQLTGSELLNALQEQSNNKCFSLNENKYVIVGNSEGDLETISTFKKQSFDFKQKIKVTHIQGSEYKVEWLKHNKPCALTIFIKPLNFNGSILEINEPIPEIKKPILEIKEPILEIKEPILEKQKSNLQISNQDKDLIIGETNLEMPGYTLDDVFKNENRQKYEAIAYKAAAEVASQNGFSRNLKMNPNQGWNGVAFVNEEKTHLIKFAKGRNELEDFKEISKIQNVQGMSFCLPTCIYDVKLNGMNIHDDEGRSYTVQIMPFYQHDTSLTLIMKRILSKECWMKHRPSDENYYEVKFNRETDLKLMEHIGESYARFQRGGIENDSKLGTKKTIMHGDLFHEHILIQGYKIQNLNLDGNNLAPKFALVDIATCTETIDDDCTKLLCDPMFLSTCGLLEHEKVKSHVLGKGLLDFLNHFYKGYVKALSVDTLQTLETLFATEDSAYTTFKKAAMHGSKPMKTAEQEFADMGVSKEELEREIANLHRLCFLKAYYQLHNNHNMVDKVDIEQKEWSLTSLSKVGK